MKKVLLIEDDQLVANIYRNKFSVEGFQVEVASDGQAGLDKIHGSRPDVVILDLMLPKINGVELMKRVRAEPNLKQLPIVVFSNSYLTSMVQEAWKAGASKCLSKANCTPRQLIEIVQGMTIPTVPPPPVPERPASPALPPKASQPAATPSEAKPTQVSDAEFQADLRKSFIDGLPATLASLRASLKGVTKAENEMARLKQMHELYRRVHAVTGNSGLCGMAQIARISDALEALLKELYEKPKTITASTLRTLASAVDFLGVLFEQGNQIELAEMPGANILVVDDEAISRRAVTYALEKAKLKSLTVEDPQVAYNLLVENKFELIFLDVDMPGMNGFELCSKLRSLPEHQKTPVIFVTTLSDFETRTNSMMSGGTDLIAKPFLFIELAVKALVYLFRARLEAPPPLAAAAA